MTLDAIRAAVSPYGLIPRGGFHPAAGDGVPDLPDGRPVGTLVLLGNAGPGVWRCFSAAPEAQDGAPDPLDRWSRRILTAVAAAYGATALFPFGGPPYLPFQRWAERSEPVHRSPLGMLIHPVYGLWHAYRGALAFAGRVSLPIPAATASPCDSCAGRPCLQACPVGAFGASGYDTGRCRGHLARAEGQPCFPAGCLARAACPVGRDYAYAPEQARFHLRAFAEAPLRSRSQAR